MGYGFVTPLCTFMKRTGLGVSIMQKWEPLYLALTASLFLPLTALAMRLGSGGQPKSVYVRAAGILFLLVLTKTVSVALAGAATGQSGFVVAILFFSIVSAFVDFRVAWRAAVSSYRSNRAKRRGAADGVDDAPLP